MPPEATTLSAERALRATLAAVSRRLCAARVLRTAAAAALSAAVFTILLLGAGTSRTIAIVMPAAAAATGAGILLRRSRRHWTTAAAAAAVEHSSPAIRNVVITADELLREPGRARPWIQARVLSDAAAALESARPGPVVSLRRGIVLCAAATALWILAVAGLPERAARFGQQTAHRPSDPQAEGSAGQLAIMARIVPPHYIRSAPVTIQNPERIEAVEGSRLILELVVDSVASAFRRKISAVRFGATPLKTSTVGDKLVAELVLERSGYIAIDEGTRHTSRLIPVAVTPDRAPVLLIDTPGKDLLLPKAIASVPVAVSATDDIGLRSIELRFTKVSGSGEQFNFEEGTIPLKVTREDDRSWKGQGTLALARMGLGPGDSLVYRVVGRDGREGEAGIGSSDTHFVEIAGPGQVAMAGFELPPDSDRYALSQQMIVIKIERLRARERAMTRDALAEEVAGLAAEQRSVRANFIFLTGGHVEDEEEEAEHSHEIQEGRLENTARREIQRAIHFMSGTERALAAIDTAAALPPARAAAQALERAFGRNRYFLRTAPVRSRLDPSRRLTGELDTASDWRRVGPAPAPAPRTRAAREMLATLLDIAPALASSAVHVDPEALTKMAERALAVDAVGDPWPLIARRLLELGDAVAEGRPAVELISRLNAALAPLVAETQEQAVTPGTVVDRDHALRSAWAEQHR